MDDPLKQQKLKHVFLSLIDFTNTELYDFRAVHLCGMTHKWLIEKLLENPRGDGFLSYLSTFLIFMRIGYFFLLLLREKQYSLCFYFSLPHSNSINENLKYGQI